ncbi:3,2-trans-enoyl-CoA isomerase, Delta(2)-enoyl-CoA isomerase [Fonsecaea pedrosoi]|nr:3,2-trans-enoyl-CoA isomerase, Delta(2)-enoyl-CoA isomerase [Fonsecaea pedrosoi]
MSVSVEYRGRVAIVTLNNPKRLNALTSQGYFQLAQTMRDIAQRPDITATVLVGKGRLFSAGADVKDGQAAREKTDATGVLSHPKVLVTALNGPVIGLSAALVCHSDFVYAMPNVYLHAPFTKLGIAAEGASTVTLIQQLGPRKAAEALLMSKRISCEDLVRVGFINQVFDTQGNEDAFLSRVLEELDRCLGADLSADAVLRVKALMRTPQTPLLASQTLAETLGVVDRLSSATSSATSRFAKVANKSTGSKL